MWGHFLFKGVCILTVGRVELGGGRGERETETERENRGCEVEDIFSTETTYAISCTSTRMLCIYVHMYKFFLCGSNSDYKPRLELALNDI